MSNKISIKKEPRVSLREPEPEDILPEYVFARLQQIRAEKHNTKEHAVNIKRIYKALRWKPSNKDKKSPEIIAAMASALSGAYSRRMLQYFIYERGKRKNERE